MRDYLSIKESGNIIAQEVVDTGVSRNWSAVSSNTIDLAKNLENHLAKFNIGFIDPKTGSWGQKRDGTRYFTTMGAVTYAKNKLGSIIASFKK